MSTALVSLTSKLAAQFDMGDGADLMETLKATAFKGQVSDAQMTALLVVANQFGLNPWTKEIYAFPDRQNGIVPVVGVDGWARIINSHPQFDGMEFEQDEESCTCIMYRKDRSRPVKVTEYMSECKRSGVGPWSSHPRRMLRHKAMIQCSRLAFGFGGIFDHDEAERIVSQPEKDITPRAEAIAATVEAPPQSLIDAMRAAASDGVASYQKAWAGLTKAQRISLAAHHDENKALAIQSDEARIIEAATDLEEDAFAADFAKQMEQEGAQ